MYNPIKFSIIILIFISLNVKAQEADSIKLNNATLYYYTYGQGEPIIILSGGPGVASHQEDNLAIVLSNQFKAILFDQRGTGKSWTNPFDSTTINIENAVNDIEILRKHLNIDKLIISGHSWGAMLASAYTVKHPNNVKNLILIGGGELNAEMTEVVDESINVRLRLGDTTTFNYWNDSINVNKNPELAKNELKKLYWASWTYDGKKLGKVLEQVQHGKTSKKMEELMWKDFTTKRPNWIPQLRENYEGKALVIFGWQDPIGITTLSMYKEAYPRATIKGINKCGHMPSVEQPEIFFNSIINYLNE